MCVLVFLCVCYQFDEGVVLFLVGVGILSRMWDPHFGALPQFQATLTLEIVGDLPCLGS